MFAIQAEANKRRHQDDAAAHPTMALTNAAPIELGRSSANDLEEAFG